MHSVIIQILENHIIFTLGSTVLKGSMKVHGYKIYLEVGIGVIMMPESSYFLFKSTSRIRMHLPCAIVVLTKVSLHLISYCYYGTSVNLTELLYSYKSNVSCCSSARSNHSIHPNHLTVSINSILPFHIPGKTRPQLSGCFIRNSPSKHLQPAHH